MNSENKILEHTSTVNSFLEPSQIKTRQNQLNFQNMRLATTQTVDFLLKFKVTVADSHTEHIL